jgi:hypothetical protein
MNGAQGIMNIFTAAWHKNMYWQAARMPQAGKEATAATAGGQCRNAIRRPRPARPTGNSS